MEAGRAGAAGRDAFGLARPPRCPLAVRVSGRDDKAIDAVIAHPLNVQMEILYGRAHPAPASDEGDEEEGERTTTVEATVTLAKLVDPEVIATVVRPGRLMGLARRRRIDADDCVALLPSGVLVLSLTKDTYEQAGLAGQRASVAYGDVRFGNPNADYTPCHGRR